MSDFLALLTRARNFLSRHRWSVPLSLGSALFFVRLANEVLEGDVDSFDRALQHAVDSWRGTADAVMLAATDAGGVLPMTALSAGVLVWLVLERKPREAQLLAVGAGGALLLNVLLKLAFHRARPAASLAYLISQPQSLSFPSGHTMGTTGVIGSLVVITYAVRARRGTRWLATVLGVAVIVLVGVSRVYLGAHYPSDVLGGFLAAAAWLSAVAGWTYPRLLPGEHDAGAETAAKGRRGR